MKNQFKAPQVSLKTSWAQTVFTKPKSTGTIIKRSLSSRAKPIFKERGQLTTLSQDHSY
jgi:hypothetical protein